MKDYKIKKEDIKKLIDINESAIISDRITVDGELIGYMYRESPSNSTDSGWRFLKGDESEEYTNNPDNFSIVSLNTACNYSTDIIPYLDSDIGISYERVDGVIKLVNNGE